MRFVSALPLLLWCCSSSEEEALDAARSADLARAEEQFLLVENDASSRNALANLAYIRRAEVNVELFLQSQGKAPLAALSQQHDCGGFSDIFWTSEFSLRRMAREPSSPRRESHQTLGTLLADSGATEMALTHFARANSSVFRTALTIPAVYDSIDDLATWRERLERGVSSLRRSEPILETLDQNTMPGTFYIVYMGYQDAELMTTLQAAYARAYPDLSLNLRPLPSNRKKRIGFVSSYLERRPRHSICKLFCGLVRGLESRGFDIVAYETEPLLSTRTRVDVDVLVFTDIGMETRNLMWAHSRIAPVQILTWGHPHTSGLPDTIDYFVSSDLFHGDRLRHTAAATELQQVVDEQSFFAEQLIRFESLGFYFSRPPVALMFGDTIDFGPNTTHVYLCPQSTPKFHPKFDQVLLRLLREAPQRNAALVITYDPKKTLWMHALRRRLLNATQSPSSFSKNLIFLPLQTDFSRLLRSATLLLDPFPFGGGVTTLEAFSLCRLVVTAPSLQTVPALAAGMYKHAGLEDVAPIVSNVDEYVDTVHSLVDHPEQLKSLQDRLCRSHDNPRTSVYSSQASIDEWARFLDATLLSSSHH